jgi:site-specific recombinase XerD
MNEIIRNLPAIIEQTVALPTTLREALDKAADFAAASWATSTRASYASSFRIFSEWCAEHGLSALPTSPAAVAAFIGDQATSGMKVATLGRRISAIKYKHGMENMDSPTDSELVKSVLRGARRTLGVAPRRMAPATSEKTIAMAALATLTSRKIAGKRDRAILLLGFSLAARRSEIVALDVDDLEECPEGLRVRIKKSKTDQESKGVTIPVCRGSIACPVQALREYLDAAGIVSGPVFRRILRGDHPTDRRLTAQTIAKIVKSHAAKLGLDYKNYAAHSLRSGFLTSAAAAGKSIFRMMDISRHASVDAVRIYVREADAFRDHPGDGLL